MRVPFLNTVVFGLAIGVLPVAGAPGGAVIAPPIALYTQFEQAPPQPVMDALQEEVGAIMSPIGLRFEWRSLRAAKGNEVSAELAVVTLTGRCDAGGLGLRSKIEGALGFTHISDGQILPFTELNCDRLRSFIQGELIMMAEDERETAFGRALGRVLAHELYHVFAHTTRHGSGVAKEAYTVQDLVCDEFSFQRKESQMLRDSRLQVPGEPATTASSGNM